MTRIERKDLSGVAYGCQPAVKFGGIVFALFLKDEKKPYSCGTCHTTGYRKSGTVFSEMGIKGTAIGPMPGIKGDWAHFNITGEACHGPGAAHAAAPRA